MVTRDEQFREQLRATFRIEAEEHLLAIGAGLLELEKTPAASERRRIIESIFRAAHSLKGAARAVNFTEIESICQSLEDVFASWKRQESAPARAALDKAHDRLNAITAALAASGGARDAGMPSPSVPAAVRPEATGGAEKPPHEGTVRISVAKLDARLLEAEEMLTAKLAAGQRVDDLRELAGRLEAWRREWAAVEPELRALRQAIDRAAPGRAEPRLAARLTGMLDFFDWNLDYFKSLENRVATLTRAAEQDFYVVGKLVDDLLEDSKALRMLPFATVTRLFPKLVRDLCRDQGKEAELAIRGEEVEIDKRILEEMKDPLIHLLRNCVDHGVERPDERKRLGKAPCATITLAASQLSDGKVELIVSDDGAGIDVEKVKKSAVEHGLIPEEEARHLDESGALDLAFRPDVSTSPSSRNCRAAGSASRSCGRKPRSLAAWSPSRAAGMPVPRSASRCR